jgi:hypothetical protein
MAFFYSSVFYGYLVDEKLQVQGLEKKYDEILTVSELVTKYNVYPSFDSGTGSI